MLSAFAALVVVLMFPAYAFAAVHTHVVGSTPVYSSVQQTGLPRQSAIVALNTKNMRVQPAE